jgi:hypothetical protein
MKNKEENSEKLGKIQKNSISFHISTYLSSIFSKSFHYSTDFSSIQLIFLPYFPNLITIQLTFLPYFPYHFTKQKQNETHYENITY